MARQEKRWKLWSHKFCCLLTVTNTRTWMCIHRPDTIGFDHKGNLLFVSNQLNRVCGFPCSLHFGVKSMFLSVWKYQVNIISVKKEGLCAKQTKTNKKQTKNKQKRSEYSCMYTNMSANVADIFSVYLLVENFSKHKFLILFLVWICSSYRARWRSQPIKSTSAFGQCLSRPTRICFQRCARSHSLFNFLPLFSRKTITKRGKTNLTFSENERWFCCCFSPFH